MAATETQYIIKPGEGVKVDIGGLGVDFKIWGKTTNGAISMHVETRDLELRDVIAADAPAPVGPPVVLTT